MTIWRFIYASRGPHSEAIIEPLHVVNKALQEVHVSEKDLKCACNAHPYTDMERRSSEL